jgi:acyl carrier protein
MYEQLRQVLMTTFQVDPAEVTPDVTLAELGLDSLDLVELAMAISPFGVHVSDDDLADLQHIGAIVAFIESPQPTVSS